MRPHPARSAAFRLALSAMGVAACGLGLTDSARHSSRLVFSVHSFFGSVLGGDFVSVLDTARLTIDSDGIQQTLSRTFGTGDSEMTFDVTVKSGPAMFSLDVISNTGTPLYHGETATTIDGDGFAVNITPQADTAVLVIYPGHGSFTQIDNGQLRFVTDTLRVRNSGSRPMSWRMAPVGQLPTSVTVSCSAPVHDASCLSNVQWTAGTDEIIVVQFGMPSGTVFTLPATLQFLSTVGNVTVPTSP